MDIVFDAGSTHVMTATIRNLVSFPVACELLVFENDTLLLDSPVCIQLSGDEVQTQSWTITFGDEGTYVITVRAYAYDPAILNINEYLDRPVLGEASSTVSVRPSAIPADGEFVCGYVWWEPLPDWVLITTRPWPANVPVTVAFKIRNTGGQRGTFMVTFMGGSGSTSLAPGVLNTPENWIMFEVTGSPGSYTYTACLYVDGRLVDSWPILVTFS